MEDTKNGRILIASVLLLSVLLSGCKYSKEIPPTDTTEQAEITATSYGEQLVGRYRCESEENGETVLEIYCIDGTLIAEADQEYAAYFAAELIPEDPEVIDRPETKEAVFTSYAFSGFSNFGQYWEEKPKITVKLTEYGLLLTESDSKTVEFELDDTIEPIHIADRYKEFFSETPHTPFTDEMLGTWTADVWGGYRILLRLNGDGTLVYYCKKENEPVIVHIGIGAVSDSGLINVVTERVGYAEMPYQYSLEYELTPTGILILKNCDTDGLLPTEDEIAMTQDNLLGKK